MTARALAEHVCGVLYDAGHQAYLAGGCVRDLLLDREPADYDVATNATPERVAQLFPGSLMVGAQFGVVVVTANAVQVEVATFRMEAAYSDGRHPDHVAYAQTAEEDVRRRDFTINGLLLDPRSGAVMDYVGGRADLAAGMVRAIGDAERRFGEDKLRMLRAVRFAARFGYQIEAQTLAAIRTHCRDIVQVSAERIRDELTKILTEGGARRGFELLDQTGLLVMILPEITKMKGVEQPPQFHPEGDVWTHTLMMLDGLEAGGSGTLGWGVLLHDVGKPPTFASASQTGDRIRFDRHAEVGTRMAEDICRRLRFSNEDTAQIAALVANHLRFIDVFQMRPATLKRFVRLTLFEEHLALHRLDCLNSNGQLENHDFVRRFIEETPPELVRPSRLLTGDDLKEMGFNPGPLFKQILTAVEDAQLEGALTDHADAVRFVEARYPRVNHARVSPS